MSLGSLVSDLFGKAGDVFTSDQEKVVSLLKDQGYSVVATCRRFQQYGMIGEPASAILNPTLVLLCDYQMFQKDGDIFVVGDINSIYYGGRTIGGVVGTLGMHCSRKDEHCDLQEIRDRFGKTLLTRELLRQLKHGY